MLEREAFRVDFSVGFELREEADFPCRGDGCRCDSGVENCCYCPLGVDASSIHSDQLQIELLGWWPFFASARTEFRSVVTFELESTMV